MDDYLQKVCTHGSHLLSDKHLDGWIRQEHTRLKPVESRMEKWEKVIIKTKKKNELSPNK